jgi:predicted transcriptional regulator
MSDNTNVKEQARQLIESLPDDITWEDIASVVFERQRIEEGIADLEAGRVWTSDQIRRAIGL